MPTQQFSDEQYRQRFCGGESIDPRSVQAVALEHALDIRKFEIELYWKRASYFWTFIGAALAGYVAIQASASQAKEHLSILLSCLGLTFSFAWLLANRGSKYWQENWENHVDMLEDAVTGPLYKVVLSRNDPANRPELIAHLFTGPSAFSVSKINQLLSMFVTSIWIVLLVGSLPPFSFRTSVNWTYAFEIGMAVLACTLMVVYGRTYDGGYWHKGTIRTTSINNGT
ncbi:RipA family octameric membrane protein [Luteimonas sp. A277]